MDVLLRGAVWLCCDAGDGCSGCCLYKVQHFGAFLLLKLAAVWP